jgi:hypothetical protein
MEKLKELRDIRKEVLNMEFSYKNVHRIMYLIYESKFLFESGSPIPNKDIALHQTNKIISHELMKLITSDDEVSIKNAFNEVIDNYKLVLAYIA